MDGKQRSNAISGFLNGDYALSADIPAVMDDEGNTEDFSGMTFDLSSQLLKRFQICRVYSGQLDRGQRLAVVEPPEKLPHFILRHILIIVDSQIVVNKQLIKTVKARTHFISAVYYCYLAVEAEKSQDEINNTLADFFSGNPSTSDDNNQKYHFYLCGILLSRNIHHHLRLFHHQKPNKTYFGQANKDRKESYGTQEKVSGKT